MQCGCKYLAVAKPSPCGCKFEAGTAVANAQLQILAVSKPLQCSCKFVTGFVVTKDCFSTSNNASRFASNSQDQQEKLLRRLDDHPQS